ncbi:MAG TPA: hypothetical protein VJU77_14920 [Chthoniobacterales bacterium]|nr:hypothetical protein [Chthoniobacterales bacterium]
MYSPIRFFAVVTLSLLWLMLCPASAPSSEPPKYLAKVTFAKGLVLHFPDFDVTPAEKRRVTPPQYPRGWWVYDFVVRSKSGEQTVSWSAGTGDIGPARFKVDGGEFQIELAHSDKLGALGEDELVISKVERR